MLSIPQLKHVASRDPYLYEALKRIVGYVNALGSSGGVAPAGHLDPPPRIASLSVVAANGLFDVAIVDSGAVLRGISYFVESDTSASFPRPRVYPLGPSRNASIFLGNQTLYFRAYSQYLGSDPSVPVAFGSPPTAVVGGGVAPPPPQPSQGSGGGVPPPGGGGGGGGSGFGKLR